MTVANVARRLKSRQTEASGRPALVLASDAARLPDPCTAAGRLPAGSAVLLRHYGEPGRERLARRLAAVCRRRRLVLLVAADWRLAARIGADGVHLPEGLARGGVLAPLLGWRRRRGARLSVACHGRAALARAAALGADWAVLSPVFPTASHPGAPVLGRQRFAALARAARLPVYALGGVNDATAAGLLGSGAAGIAGIGFGLS